MDFSDEARTVLIILSSFQQKNIPATLESIQIHSIWGPQRIEGHSLTKTVTSLINSGLVSQSCDKYSLTKQGVLQVKQWMSEGYSAMMVASEQSATSRKFCERVYGLNLCQFNTLSMAQLDKLVAVMDLDEDDQVLDLGCGVGLISEHISDMTGAKVTGVDFAAGAIERAQEKTRQKRSRLSYQVKDLEEMSLSRKSYSGVISIDALHLVNDLRKTMQSTKECLQPNGRMGIFYATTLVEGEPLDHLKPEQTPLGKVLAQCGLNFETWDFTQDEEKVWERILRVAGELKQAYQKEGTLYLYEMTVADARTMLQAVKAGRRRRYLYHIR